MYVRRAHFVLAAALAALALAPAPAAAAPQAGASSGANRWAVLVGMEDGNGTTGLQLRGDLEFTQRPLSSVVGFAIVGSVAFSRFSDSGGYVDYPTGYDLRWKTSSNLLKGVASARFSFGRSAVVRPYVDGGVGLYYDGYSYSEPVYVGYPYYYVQQKYSDSDVGLLLRLAGGVQFQVSPGFALGVELGFQPYIGDHPDDTLTSLLGSATFRM